MAGDRGDLVRDPTLYRVLPLVAWIPGDADPRAESRRASVEHALGQIGAMPPGATIAVRDEMAWRSAERWSVYEPQDPAASPNGWRTHRYGRSYHEQLVVLTGVEQRGLHPADAAWDETARAEIEARLGRSRWGARLTLGRLDEASDAAQAFGEAWAWTGEWPAEPEGGWAAFGRARYGTDGFACFPWGVLGYREADLESLPRFDLHTAEDGAARAGRDRFLFAELPVLVTEWLKATRLVWPDYVERLGPGLDRAERAIRTATETLPVRVTEAAVRDLSRLLFLLCHRESHLEDAVRSAAIARDAVAQALRDSRGGLRHALPHEIARHVRQLRSDLAYFRTSERRARTALEAFRTLAEVEENRIARWRGRLQELLTNLLAALGLALGVGQLLPEALFQGWGQPFLARLFLCVALGVVGFAAARAYQRWREGDRLPHDDR